jgi:hypothetical protein
LVLIRPRRAADLALCRSTLAEYVYLGPRR